LSTGSLRIGVGQLDEGMKVSIALAAV